MGNFESHSGNVLGLDMDALDVDEAYIYLRNSLSNRPAYLFTLNEQCVRCLPKLEYWIGPLVQVSSVISTKYNVDLFAAVDVARSNLTRCTSSHGSFSEFGIYNCSVSSATDDDASGLTCDCVEARSGANIYWPILCCVVFYVVLAASWIGIKYLWRKYESHHAVQNHQVELTDSSNSNEQSATSADVVPVIADALKKPKRIRSIDTFRGVAISIMIFVNYGGGDYWFFDHSPWNGLLLADLVFPWFMWLMGVCIPISARSLLRRKSSRSRAFVKVIKRSIYLIVLGLALSNFFNSGDVQKLRFCGVLQRFGIAYLIIGSMHLAFLKADLGASTAPKKYDVVKEVVDILPQWLIVLMVVAIHSMVTLMVTSEDCPRGYLGPGGRHDEGQFINCTGGVTGYIDRTVLGDKHLYQHPTIKNIYDTPLPFDPEGIMGTFQALFTVFLGVQAGMIIVIYKDHKDRITRWLTWGVLTGVIGAVLCKASKDDGWIPVNKNLWSLSFVLVTASLAFFVLAISYYVVDMAHFWTGAPFFYAGMNSILLYVGHQLTSEAFPWRWMDSSSRSAVNTHGYQLFVDLWGTTLWVLISIWLYRIKFFLAL